MGNGWGTFVSLALAPEGLTDVPSWHDRHFLDPREFGSLSRLK